ncbi:transglutaminase-like domain-containing protein [Pseudotabrizicola sp. L79]|uniref:transglutaminase-like domain-containing protein n=1 Tax=Pseudotabrizicola sp. L79 TaxID=3118402 RepID=UPI002F9475FC
MRIAIDVTLDYGFPDARVITAVIEAARTEGQVVIADYIDLGDLVQMVRVPGDSDVGTRILAQTMWPRLMVRYSATVELTREVADLGALQADALIALPGDVLPYLRASRYVQPELFGGFVASEFAGRSGGDLVLAIRDFVQGAMSYMPGSSNGNTTALESFAAREGVCRDYAHLTCALVRACGIPARCVAAYGPGAVPQDFHAVAEVWLEGGWHLVDSTGMCRPDGLVKIAVGRDAADIAFLDAGRDVEMITQMVSATFV